LSKMARSKRGMGVEYRIETQLVIRKSTAPRRDHTLAGPQTLTD